MSRENVGVVRRAYEVGYAQRSIEGIRDLQGDDYVFHMRHEFPSRPLYRADEMPQLWADLDETFSEFRLVPREFKPVGEYVLVTINQSARLRASDVRIDTTIYHVWLVRDGKLQATWAYSSREDAHEAVGLRE